jgi:hypothetical protein
MLAALVSDMPRTHSKMTSEIKIEERHCGQFLWTEEEDDPQNQHRAKFLISKV